MQVNELFTYIALISSTLSASFACWKFSKFIIEKNNPEAAEKWNKIASHVDRDGSYPPSEIYKISQSYYTPYFNSACKWTAVFIISSLGAFASATWF
ncbi:hypothetical protein K5D56_04515 [Pseudomonas cichorii]|nr:hypothetical protein [Pseudomonas cichorii]